ncbi:MAG: hypothetical protein U0795_17660 [Pirellulales bacterium]
MDYSDWYRELEQETEDQVWCISLNCTADFSTSIEEWTAFLRRVAEIRRQKRKSQGPVTTYTWYDDQACQLRFATAHCGPDELPFGCQVELQPSPDAIISSWLNAHDHIPWHDLEDAHNDESTNYESAPPLRVWAICAEEN